MRHDIKELEDLLAKAVRPKIQGILTVELRKLQTEYIKKEEKIKEQGESGAETQNVVNAEAATAKPTVPSIRKGYTKEITTYGMCSCHYPFVCFQSFFEIGCY